MTTNLQKARYNTPELIIQSTARIECTFSNGKRSTGTSFFYRYSGKDYNYPVLVTNRHVIKDKDYGPSIEGKCILSKKDVAGNRLHHQQIPVGFHGYTDGWIPHPDEKVDLCILPLAPWFEIMQEKDIDPFVVCNDTSSMPTKEQWDSLSPLEKITMIGYPDGLWDEVNNLPIARIGHTATAANIDYNGRREFLIDAAVYPGSSGSPVYLFEESIKLNKSEKESTISQRTRLHLLGIASAVRTQNWDGTIELREIPIARMPISVTAIPINLGVVIKSTRLVEFEPVLRRLDPDNPE
ncbi:MAG: S1 family peptidase, partial [Nitrososphaerales archaeon]